MNFRRRLENSIPGGAHTYSRGHDQFPSNAPEILDRGKGVYIFDASGREFLDYGMGLRSVNIGYSETEIDDSAIAQIRKGNNLTRPSLIELEAAELMIDLIDSVEMVKFAKNGSTVVTAAVKLARAYTGKRIVLICKEHPFFSYDDWFISSTQMSRGIPKETSQLVKTFSYNDIDSVRNVIEEFQGQIACLVMEPATSACPSTNLQNSACCEKTPCDRFSTGVHTNFLVQVQALCNKNGIVFVLDEMITGFRWNLKGAQSLYGVKPDLSTFGKAMANGFSVACLAGKSEIMKLGAAQSNYEDRVFLTSTTHGAEMSGLGAFIGTVKFMTENQTIDKIWNYGDQLRKLLHDLLGEFGLESTFKIAGPACSPVYSTYDQDGLPSPGMKTLFMQEMISNGVLMPWIAVAHRHGPQELEKTETALRNSFRTLEKARDEGFEKFLEGPIIKPVFQKPK